MLTIKEEIYNLSDFEFWGGAVSRYEEIQKLGLETEVMSVLIEQYPDGLTKTELNDYFWFDLDDFIEEMNENLND